MGRTEAGAGAGVPWTVQKVSIKGQRMGRTEARAGTGVPGTVQEVSIRGRGRAEKNIGRSWYRSSWDSSGGHTVKKR